MSDATEIARPYALAAFKQASEEQAFAAWSEMLDLLALIAADPVMLNFIAHPQVSAEQLSDCFLAVAVDRLSETGCNFVRVLAHYRRLALCPQVARIYAEERARYEKRSAVTVTSAYPLTAAERSTITAAMTNRLGTEVDLTLETDRLLIGGVVIRFGDQIIDASLRGRLTKLSQAMR